MTPEAEQRIRRAVAQLGDALVAALEDARPGDRPDELLDVPTAAARMSLGRTAVYGLLSRNELRSVKAGRRRLIPASAIREFTERERC